MFEINFTWYLEKDYFLILNSIFISEVKRFFVFIIQKSNMFHVIFLNSEFPIINQIFFPNISKIFQSNSLKNCIGKLVLFLKVFFIFFYIILSYIEFKIISIQYIFSFSTSGKSIFSSNLFTFSTLYTNFQQ